MDRLFRHLDHEDFADEDVVCLGVFNEDGYPVAWQVFDEWYEAAHALVDASHHRVALHLVRHCAELGLKVAGYEANKEWKEGHSLRWLIGELPSEHVVRSAADGDPAQLRSFLEEIDDYDRGDPNPASPHRALADLDGLQVGVEVEGVVAAFASDA